jgi:hypothetical protein
LVGRGGGWGLVGGWGGKAVRALREGPGMNGEAVHGWGTRGGAPDTQMGHPGWFGWDAVVGYFQRMAACR